MKDYIYDGSFEGLLTAIYYAYPSKDTSRIYREYDYIPNMLNEQITVSTEEDKFEKVYNSISDKLSSQTLRTVYYLYLYDIERVENLILDYLRLCYKNGDRINLAKHNDIIIKVDKCRRRVSLEAHRFTGFVRFEEVGNLSFYSSIEPDHNILPIIMKHFKRRFSDQNFIIHDVKRNQAIIYNKEKAIISYFDEDDAAIIKSSTDDNEFKSLWKTFYDSVNIKERENLKLRNRSMPKRYWDYLTELQ